MSHGLYIHIPFCRSRCSYCHFLSVPYKRESADRYISAVLKEIEQYSLDAKHGATINSIYFGGGTPSLLPDKSIDSLLSVCRKQFSFTDDCEITLEANPGTISKSKASAYRRSGINRISIGAQSFIDRELSLIGRTHTAQMILDSLGYLKRSGFNNLSLDLMLGTPGQTKASWRETLRTMEGLDISHVSVYMLDLDEPCPLQTSVAKSEVSLPEDDLISDLYLETIDFLASRGYLHYEISNFARPGYTSRHNLKYWTREPVLGFGLGSHSFDRDTRWVNKTRLSEYLNAVEAGESPIARIEPVGNEQALQEALFLGLRLKEGIDWERLQNTYRTENLPRYVKALEDLSQKGFIHQAGKNIRLTPSGMLISNEIFQLFI